jgi:hypothetical protein
MSTQEKAQLIEAASERYQQLRHRLVDGGEVGLKRIGSPLYQVMDELRLLLSPTELEPGASADTVTFMYIIYLYSIYILLLY